MVGPCLALIGDPGCACSPLLWEVSSRYRPLAMKKDVPRRYTCAGQQL